MLGRVGLPEPVVELAARRWDVGGGRRRPQRAHRGRLPRPRRAVPCSCWRPREQLGGAATLDRPFADERTSSARARTSSGLLHPLVVEELGLRRHGFDLVLLDPSLWCPFADGTSIAVYADAERTLAQVAALAPADVDGYPRLRGAVRAHPPRAAHRPPRHLGGPEPRPGRARGAARTTAKPSTCSSHRSIADVVEEHVRDERLRALLHGQGVIGTWAGPRDPGTAGVHAMHAMGTLADGRWGYVRGGTGRVSFALADAAREHGAVLASGVPVAAIEPGVGVRLEGGELIRRGGRRLQRRPQAHDRAAAPPTCRRPGARGWRTGVPTSPVLKINCALSRLPAFPAAAEPGLPHRAMVTITSGHRRHPAGVRAGGRGRARRRRGRGVLPDRPTTRASRRPAAT